MIENMRECPVCKTVKLPNGKPHPDYKFGQHKLENWENNRLATDRWFCPHCGTLFFTDRLFDEKRRMVNLHRQLEVGILDKDKFNMTPKEFAEEKKKIEKFVRKALLSYFIRAEVML